MWSNLKKTIWQWRGVLFVAPTVATLVILLRLTGLLQGSELWALDQLIRLRPPEKTDDRIVIIGIEEADITAYNHPVPDRILAQGLEKIKQQQPRAIGIDIYRDVPVEPGHQELVKVFKTTPNLIGIEKVSGAGAGEGRVAPSPVLKELGQIAANDIPRDSDSKVRRGLFYLKDTSSGGQVLSLSFMLALLYLEKEGISATSTEDDRQWVQIQNTLFPAFEANEGGYVRADDAGYQVLLNYRGPRSTFKIVSFQDVIEGKIPPDLFRDRIVLIGSTAPSLNDYFDTPYSSTLVTAPSRISGVEIHANIISQVLSSTLDGRTQIRAWPEPVEWLWILVASIAGSVLSWRWRYTKGTLKLVPQIVAIAGLGGTSYFAFLNGLWIPIIPPFIALVGSSVAIIAYIARTAADIRQTFSRYLTDEVVANLLETPEGLKMGGERREITILTSDLRGFTSISERLDPQEVVSILNIYLEAMADAITYYQGTIDEFMGDGILVLFGAPTQREDDAERAVACAVAMQLAMVEVNQKMVEFGLQLEMGIGINTGVVVVGNIGSLKRTKYGVVGAQVNLTYRIESYTVGGQILISESTGKLVQDMIQIDDEQKVSPKGVKEPITIYSVAGVGGKYNLSLTKKEDVLFTLAESIPVQFTVLEGKHVGNEAIEGSLIKLSPHSAELKTEIALSVLSNLKLLLNGRGENEFYAKVLAQSTEHSSAFRIRLTSVPADVATILQTYYPGEEPAA